MTALATTFDAFRSEGRRAALEGVPIDRNPALARSGGSDGTPDTDEVWAAKKAAWQRGHDEGIAEVAARI